MFAVSLTVNVKQGMMEQTWQFWNEHVIHSKHHLTGFKGAVVLVGHDHQSIREISLWETREHANAVFGSDWGQDMMESFGQFIQGQPTIETFDAITVTPRMEVSAFAGVM